MQDILWDAGIDPRFDTREASETDFMVLYQCIIVRIVKRSKEIWRGHRSSGVPLFLAIFATVDNVTIGVEVYDILAVFYPETDVETMREIRKTFEVLKSDQLG